MIDEWEDEIVFYECEIEEDDVDAPVGILYRLADGSFPMPALPAGQSEAEQPKTQGTEQYPYGSAPAYAQSGATQNQGTPNAGFATPNYGAPQQQYAQSTNYGAPQQQYAQGAQFAQQNANPNPSMVRTANGPTQQFANQVTAQQQAQQQAARMNAQNGQNRIYVTTQGGIPVQGIPGIPPGSQVYVIRTAGPQQAKQGQNGQPRPAQQGAQARPAQQNSQARPAQTAQPRPANQSQQTQQQATQPAQQQKPFTSKTTAQPQQATPKKSGRFVGKPAVPAQLKQQNGQAEKPVAKAKPVASTPTPKPVPKPATEVEKNNKLNIKDKNAKDYTLDETLAYDDTQYADDLNADNFETVSKRRINENANAGKKEEQMAKEKASAKTTTTTKAAEKPATKAAEKPVSKDPNETIIIASPTPDAPHGKFVIKKTENDNFVFKLFSSNKKVVAISAGAYSSLSACKNGIQSVINNAATAPIEDQTLKTVTEEKCPKWIIFTDKRGEARLRLLASNGNMVAATNDGYTTKAAAKKGIEAIIRAAENCDVVRNDSLW